MPYKTTVRWFFIGLVPVLFIQLLVAKLYEEPYPAVMFPGFGQVPPPVQYPYSFERMVLHAYTPTDSVPLLLEELFTPFPELTLLPPLRSRLRFIADTITPAQGKEAEQELLYYLRNQVRQQIGDQVQRIEVAFYRCTATQDGQVSLVDLIDRKVLYF